MKAISRAYSFYYMKNLKSYKDWKEKKAIIVMHEATHGPAHDLRDFLLKSNIKELLFIAHPLLYMKDTYKNASRYELYKHGKLIKKNTAFYWVLPEPLLYVKDFIYSLFWSIRMNFKADIFIGVGNINAFSGNVLQMFGCVASTVFYVIDYVPYRFTNKIFNEIYHRIDKISAERSNWTWNLSPRMIGGREKKWNKKFPNQLVVPHGVHFARIKRVSFEEINKNEILYMGTLYRKQGVQLVIEAMQEIRKKIPNIKFSIIGKGPYEQELKMLVKEYKVEQQVDFLGYIPSHEVMENRMAHAAIAMALYDKNSDKNDFTYYADPGKVKNYLGAGVPLVITDVPYIAKQIVNAKCGFLVKFNTKNLINTLIHYFSNTALQKEYRKNAIEFAKRYEWESVFTRAFMYSTK